MTQQTALDWLKHELFKAGSGTPAAYSLLFEQAKEMEKEQIGNAWVDGYKNYKEVLNHSRLEQYYNETYGKSNGS